MLVAMDSPQRPLMSLLGYNKIQDGGRPPFEKRKIAITHPLFEMSSQNVVRWWTWTGHNVP